MGLFSAIQKFHGAGEAPNKSNVVDFGEPVRSLYTALQLGNLHQQIDITDDQNNVCYYTKSSIFALKGKTDIYDASGNVVAHLEKRPVSLHEKHFVTMADGTKFTLSNELFHIVKDITNIEGLDWQLRGNIVGLNFNLMDEKGNPIATVGKKMISLHDKYCIDLYQPEHEQKVVAIVIQLEKMLNSREEDREENQSFFGFSF